MSAAGLIIAPNKEMGNHFKNLMGLRYWWVCSPRSLRGGDFRGLNSEPRVLILDEFGGDPMKIWDEVEDMVRPGMRGTIQVFAVRRHAV